jgi:hypothetical protein
MDRLSLVEEVQRTVVRPNQAGMLRDQRMGLDRWAIQLGQRLEPSRRGDITRLVIRYDPRPSVSWSTGPI